VVECTSPELSHSEQTTTLPHWCDSTRVEELYQYRYHLLLARGVKIPLNHDNHQLFVSCWVVQLKRAGAFLKMYPHRKLKSDACNLANQQ